MFVYFFSSSLAKEKTQTVITKNSSAYQHSSLADIVKRTVWGASEKHNHLLSESGNFEIKDSRNAIDGAIEKQQKVVKTVIKSDQEKDEVKTSKLNSSPKLSKPNGMDSPADISTEGMNAEVEDSPEDDNDSGNDDSGDIESLSDLKTQDNQTDNANTCKSHPNRSNDVNGDIEGIKKRTEKGTNSPKSETSSNNNRDAKNLSNHRRNGSLRNGHDSNKENREKDEDEEICQNSECGSNCDANGLAESPENCDNQRRLTYCEVARLSKNKLEEESAATKQHEAIVTHKEAKSTLTPLRALSREYHTRYLVLDNA